MKKASVTTLLAAAAILFAAAVAWHHRTEIACELAHKVHGICADDILIDDLRLQEGKTP
jgi:hypothetical protein